MKITAPIIGVEWEDAHGSDGTISAHEIDHKPYVYTTVGFLVRSDEIGVSVAFEQGEDGKFRDITFVPRKMIVREFPISPKKVSRGPKRSHPKPDFNVESGIQQRADAQDRG